MNLRKIKSHYSADPEAWELLVVECTGGSEAIARFYLKNGKGGWSMVFRCPALIGKNGLGKQAEGDARTPSGELKPLAAFGILPHPGCVLLHSGIILPYIRIEEGTIACDAEGPFYNRIVKPSDYEGSNPPEGERMWELSPEYDYGIQTDYNSACAYPAGSAIFIHCRGAKAWTGGCIAIDKRYMKRILQSASDGLRIFIG